MLDNNEPTESNFLDRYYITIDILKEVKKHHNINILHYDIHSLNILIDPISKKTYLIDYDRSF